MSDGGRGSEFVDSDNNLSTVLRIRLGGSLTFDLTAVLDPVSPRSLVVTAPN